MSSCETCRSQLFAYLYDLLEPAQRQDVDTHLRDCARCRMELDSCKEQRAELAAAVKGSFADVVFKPPRVLAQPRKPAVLASRGPRRPWFLNRWAMAAAALLLVISSGGVVALTVYQYQDTQVQQGRDRLHETQDALAVARQASDQHRQKIAADIEILDRQSNDLVEEWKRKDLERNQVVQKQRIRIGIKGPKVIQPGAANRYDVQCEPIDAGQPVQIRQLRAEVLSAKQVVLNQTLAAAARSQVVLPPELPVRPGEELTLLVSAVVDGVEMPVREQIRLQTPEYVTYLSTDRPMYRPGETVHFRSLTLERFSLQPAAEDLNLRFRLVAPNQQELFRKEVSSRLVEDNKEKTPILGPDGRPLRGVGTGEFVLPANLAGGVYTLFVGDLGARFTEERRTFLVHRWQAPRFNKEVEFDRASYGPGDMVVVHGKVTRLGEDKGGAIGMGGGFPGGGGPMGRPGFRQGGGFPPPGGDNGIRVIAQVAIDGQILVNSAINNIDESGAFSVEFRIPPAQPNSNGVGAISLEFQDGGNVETLVRPIPIVLRDVLVDFYPEGGYLVAGVPNRVYFQARSGTSRPVDVRGRLLERHVAFDKLFGQEKPGAIVGEIASVQTLTDDKEPGINQGLGAFTFTPKADRRYELQLDAPIGIAKSYPLPAPRPDGVVLNLPQGVVDNDIPVKLYSAVIDRELLVGAYCRGKLLDHQPVKVQAGKPMDVVLHPAATVGGVYRVTVFDKQGAGANQRYVPVAERLLFRKQTAQLHVAIRPDKDQYAPSDSVRLVLEARSEKKTKELVPAVAMVAVIDSSVVKLVNDKTARSMPTHFLLTTEVRQPQDLENADALLGDHPRAAEALDLLLGSQGWRRFAEQTANDFNLAQIRDAAKQPGFLTSMQPTLRFGQEEQQARDNLDRSYVGKFVALQSDLALKEREEVGPAEQQQRLVSAQTLVNQAGENVNELESRRSDLLRFFLHGTLGVAAIIFVLFAFFLVSSGVHRLAEGRHGYVFVGAGVAILGFLFIVSVLGTFALMGVPDQRREFFGHGNRFIGMKAAAPMVVAQPDMGMQGGGGAPGVFDPGQDLPELDDLALNRDAMQGVPGGPPNAKGGVNAKPMPAIAPEPVVPPPVAGQNPDRQRRAMGRFTEILQARLGRPVVVPPPADLCVVREYAHQNKPSTGQVRRDFTETVCWQPALVLKDGTAQVDFQLSDAVTNYRVLVVSHTLDGRLGADACEFVSQLPYTIEPKVPVEIGTSDQVVLPVSVANKTNNPTNAVISAKVKGLRPDENAAGPYNLQLEGDQTKRKLFHFSPSADARKAIVSFQGQFDKGTDSVERVFTIVPDGFPGSGSISSTLQGLDARNHVIDMPADWVNGTLSLQVQAYPSVLADLQKGLDALLREPHGCFEQASSSNYPNVLILNYLQDTKQANPVIEKKARGLLDSGYNKLLSFECAPSGDPTNKRGYEWFGQAAPPHEALTAYGLLEFHDMARVYTVDKAMVERTRKYLLDQRDGKGGFKRNAKALDRFGRAPQPVTNAYLVWALTETGRPEELNGELNDQLTVLADQATTSKDPYFLSLVALGQLNARRTDRGIEALRRLREFQHNSGAIAGAQTSITRSGGRDLLIETTALATLGWSRAARPAEFHANLQSAGKWLLEQRSGTGGFGSTQATILALKALIAFTADNQKGVRSGDLVLSVLDGEQMIEVGHAKLTPGMTEPVTIVKTEKRVDAEQPLPVLLHPGKTTVEVRLTAGNAPLPYTLSWSYRTLKPASADAPPVHLTTHLSAPKTQEGKSVKLKAAIENRSGHDQGMAVAIIGLPAGLALPADFAQLKELARLREDGAKPGVISAWEVKGRELVLYWRDLKSDAKIEFELDLVSRLPGVYSGPAGRAYLYYNADHKHWVEPLRVTIEPAAGS